MKSEGLDKLNSRRVYLNRWLNRHKKAQEAVPFVKQNIEFTEWEIEALKNKPDDSVKVPLPNLSDKLKQENIFIKKALPMVPDYDTVILGDATAVSTSSTSAVFCYVLSVGDLGTKETVEYSDKYTEKYRKLQSDYDRLDKVRTLVSKLANPNTSKRFEQAFLAYTHSSTGIGERTSAASEIRNLLYGVKGDLFDKACNRNRENMTWEKMANRLSKGDSGSTEHQQVLDQQNNHSYLIDQLSNISKDREGISVINLDDVWTQVLDHLFIVLTLVNI